MGYEAATTHLIAAKAGTAVGSVYQFFADKAAIFNAMELRHTERVKHFWDQNNTPEVTRLPLRAMIHNLIVAVTDLFSQPVSRVVFIQFYLKREIFQSIDESMMCLVHSLRKNRGTRSSGYYQNSGFTSLACISQC